MDGIIFFSFEILLLAAISVGLLLRLSTKYGYVPFYMFIAACMAFGEITAGLGMFTFLDFNVAGTAVTIYPLVLISSIWIYELKGAEEAKKYVMGIIVAIFAVIFLGVLFLYKSNNILSADSPHNYEMIYTLLRPNLTICVASIVAFIVSIFLLFVLYNFFKSICKYPFICIFIPMSLALYADSIIFVTGLIFGKLATFELLYSHIVAKTFSALIFSLLFCLSLPLLVPREAGENNKRPVKKVEIDGLKDSFGVSAKEGFKVLVADDSPDVTELLKHTLEYEDWEVVMAKNGKEALGMVFAESPDIILLDIMMPEMDGYQVVEVLRSHRTTRDIPILMLTAKAETEDKLKGMEMGIDDYVTKPFIPDELVARIKMVTRRGA